MIGTLNLNQRDVTVVGGGIAGLLIAYKLDKKGYHVRLIESETTLGGLIRTERTPWGIAERAAHSILVTEKVRRFCDELGVELVGIRRDSKARFILRNGKMKRFPLRASEVIEAFTRAYFVLADSKTEPEKLSVSQWVKRYLGQASLDYLFNPMIHGIYGADPLEISIGAAFPSLVVPRGHSFLSYQLSKLIHRNHWKNQWKNFGKKMWKKVHNQDGNTKPVMMAPKNGMEDLVHHLEKRLRERLGDRLVTGMPVKELPVAGNIILTVPAGVAGGLLEGHDHKLSRALQEVPYTSLVCASVFVKKDKLARVPQGVGVLIPEKEGRSCLGVLFNSSAFVDRVLNEDEFVSMTVMLGGAAHVEVFHSEESRIQEVIETELRFLFGLRGTVDGCVIHQWQQAIPQYGEKLMTAWEMAKSGWCSQPGRILFGNYTGQVSLRGMIETITKG